jgi:GNAT superfamily N-acetyltransferase
MSILQVEFQKLDVAHATDDEYLCLSKFKNILNCEYRPDDPPIPLEEHIQGWKNIPDFVEHETYVAWDPTHLEIISCGEIAIFHTGDNEHAADIRVEVLSEYRNRGIGRQVLKVLLPFAQKHRRTLLISFVCDRIPEAAIWLERLGGRKGLSMHINQLKVSEFDKTLVQQWLSQSEDKHAEFELCFLDGPYPEDVIQEIAELFQEVANDQPRENLEIEDMKFTPEMFRQEEKNMFARGSQRWTLYLRDRSNGKVVGLTEVLWNPNRPMLLQQAFTGTYPAYRSRGLGRWLKAEMMRRILTDRPQVEFIRTGNANSNAPMLKINTEMGFKPYISNTVWQVDTEKVETYLKERT